ncbi:hypothetical protein [Jatrophihabitans sp.]|uniref:hypothetical protein n=1 Tax=Jatrophihabitans sp. TaxID=1932789 RepID=UPI0030C69260|nr:hypothetical protein [Jatrophihabitans sp.]
MPSFAGVWKIDTGLSNVWDPSTQSYVPDEVGEEIITIRLDGDVQDYEVLYGSHPTVVMGYNSRYDSPEWVPYLVREVRDVSEAGLEADLARHRELVKSPASFMPGTAYGLVRSVYVDERTHYRVTKNQDSGIAEYVMMRRLSEDGNRYFATVLHTNGVINRTRHFVRVG